MLLFMQESGATDADLEEAISENQVLVGQKLEKIVEIEATILQSLPHVAPKPLRFSRRLPDGLTYHGSAQGDENVAGQEEQKAVQDAQSAADGPVFGGMGDLQEDSIEELKDDDGVYL
eukprot:scaffold1466_cov249-Pinguiococcus_pyrenoidosus.AAC.15